MVKSLATDKRPSLLICHVGDDDDDEEEEVEEKFYNTVSRWQVRMAARKQLGISLFPESARCQCHKTFYGRKLQLSVVT
jgi:hypothetical protein